MDKGDDGEASEEECVEAKRRCIAVSRSSGGTIRSDSGAVLVDVGRHCMSFATRLAFGRRATCVGRNWQNEQIKHGADCGVRSSLLEKGLHIVASQDLTTTPEALCVNDADIFVKSM